ELQIFLNFRLPKALPTIFGGLKVATTLAVIGAVVGEFIAANKGLGYVQLLANGNLDTVLNFATVALLSLVGIVLFAIVSILEQVVIKWEPSDAAS
ncbi:MAG: ABC transporter permease, partial [bacterium]